MTFFYDIRYTGFTNITATGVSQGQFCVYGIIFAMKKERVLVYIDGGNTYKALFKETMGRNNEKIPPIIAKGNIFKFKNFVDFLCSPQRNLVKKKYYVGIVRDFDHSEKSQKMVLGQQKFLAKLENDDFEIERGTIVYDHTIREKGVDVKIAIDIVIDGIEDRYDTAIIVSSDTDLIPAIKYVQSKGKNVEYIGFSNRISLGMAKDCDAQRVFSLTELLPFISPS